MILSYVTIEVKLVQLARVTTLLSHRSLQSYIHSKQRQQLASCCGSEVQRQPSHSKYTVLKGIQVTAASAQRHATTKHNLNSDMIYCCWQHRWSREINLDKTCTTKAPQKRNIKYICDMYEEWKTVLILFSVYIYCKNNLTQPLKLAIIVTFIKWFTSV